MSDKQLLCFAFLLPGRFREIEAWQHAARVHKSTQPKALERVCLNIFFPPFLIKVSSEEFLWEP